MDIYGVYDVDHFFMSQNDFSLINHTDETQMTQTLESPHSDTYLEDPVAQMVAQMKVTYQKPLLDLVYEAASIHRVHHDSSKIQLSQLLSIKTGGCREDCAYCPQSAHYRTPVKAERLWNVADIVRSAQQAKSQGAARFCMGAAWSSPPKDGPVYESLLNSAKEVKKLGLEVCMTLGMLSEQQCEDLKEAGVDYYNHNLDTSREYYQKIITTRSYDDRLHTLKNVRQSGMKVCCGGIIGMGESIADRLGLLAQLCHLEEPPESVPINQYVKVAGTPLKPTSDYDDWDMVRMVALVRIYLPKTMIRLSAGRHRMNEQTQGLCFLAGANSVFIGEKLLTTQNQDRDTDDRLFQKLGLVPS